MTRVSYLAAMLATIVVVMVVASATAQDVGVSNPPGDGGPNWLDFFILKGGTITYVLIALSVVTLSLTGEHCASIRRATIIPPEPAARIKELIDERKYVEAVRYTAEEPSMMGYVVNAGLVEASNGFVAMERAVEEALDDRSARLFRKIEYLNVIGNVAPMIGLFGTVYGMILLFASIHQNAAFPPPQEVADRISIALITTFWGLAVAIPALSIFAIFRNRIDVLAAECALTAERLLAVFKGSAPMAPAQPSKAATS